MGTVLALGFAARARTTAFRAVAAASLLFLVPTIYFTFSRGAWIALGIGLIATIALDPRRLQFLATVFALLPATGLALILAYRSPALNRVHPSLHEAAAAGHRLAVWVIALAVVNALAIITFAVLEQRAGKNQRARRVFVSVLAVLLLAALVATFVNFGSPVTIARKGWDAFAAGPPKVTGSLNNRLFNLSGSGRLPQWRVAVRQFEQKPWVGSGAGTYELYWQRYRPVAGQVRDAHNLYLETLGELGIVGLVLLVLGLAPPLYAAARARGRALVPAAVGAYVAYLVHAIVDWDWELAAVTLAALGCGAAILVAARPEVSTRLVDANSYRLPRACPAAHSARRRRSRRQRSDELRQECCEQRQLASSGVEDADSTSLGALVRYPAATPRRGRARCGQAHTGAPRVRAGGCQGLARLDPLVRARAGERRNRAAAGAR